MFPGKELLELRLHVIVWKLTRQSSGQIQTVDIRGLDITVSLFIIINNKKTRQDITSQTLRVVGIYKLRILAAKKYKIAALSVRLVPLFRSLMLTPNNLYY